MSFDDEDCDGAIDLCNDTANNEIEIKIRSGQLEQVAENEVSETERRTNKLNEIYKNVLMDSEGVVRTAAAERAEMEETGTAQDEYKETVFPGQIEDNTDVPATENLTYLEFKATYRQSLSESTGDKVFNVDLIVRNVQ